MDKKEPICSTQVIDIMMEGVKHGDVGFPWCLSNSYAWAFGACWALLTQEQKELVLSLAKPIKKG